MRIVTIQLEPEKTVLSLQRKINLIIHKMLSKKVKFIIFPELSLNHSSESITKKINNVGFLNYLGKLCRKYSLYIMIGEELRFKSIIHIITPNNNQPLSFINSDLKQKKFYKKPKLFSINGIKFRIVNLLDLKHAKNNQFNSDIIVLLSSGNPVNFKYIKKKVKILGTYTIFSNNCDKLNLKKKSGESCLINSRGDILTKLENCKEGLIYSSFEL